MTSIQENFVGFNLPHLSNAYQHLSKILLQKPNQQQKVPLTANNSPNLTSPKFIIHKKNSLSINEVFKLSPNLSLVGNKQFSPQHRKQKLSETSKQKRRANFFIHLNDLKINDQPIQIKTPKDHYVALSMQRRANMTDSKKFILTQSDKILDKTVLLENYLKSKVKLQTKSHIEETINLQLVDKKTLRQEMQLIQARRMSYLLQQQQNPVEFEKIQLVNKQRFSQAISEHFIKKEIQKKEIEEKRIEEKLIEENEFHSNQRRDHKGSKFLDNKKEIKLEEIKYQPKELDVQQRDEYNEKIRQEIIANINYGQANIKRQQKLMVNKQFRMLVKEGQDKSGTTKKRMLNYKQIRQDLVNNLNYLKRLKLTPKLIMTTEVFSYKPFQKAGSHEFISACKQNDIFRIEELLKQNRFFVFDFDYISLTGLHWACKRGNYKIANLLIQYGADVDSQDLVGRTPLFFSIENNHYQIARGKLLLENFANPWSNASVQYNKLCEDKKQIMKMLNRARKLHILMRMTPPSYREDVWKLQIQGGLKV